jgi:hypothetical protein
VKVLADGEVRIEARVDDSKIPEDMKKLGNKIERQTTQLNSQNIALQKLKKSYQDFIDGSKKTPEELGILKQIKEVQQVINSIQKEMGSKKFSFKTDDYQSGQKRLLDNARKDIRLLEQELINIGRNIAGVESMKLLGNQIDNSQLKANRLNNEIRQTQKELAKVGGSKIVNMFKSIGNGIKNAFSGLSKQASGAGGAISGFTNRISRMAKTAFVFYLFRRGFQNIRKSIQGLISQDSILKSSLETINASLWTAFAPIWNACLPAIRALGNALAWVSQLIASVVSRVFGKSITQSQQMAQQMYAAGQSTKRMSKGLKDTANNAKKAKRELADFDKINVLQKKSKGKSGNDNDNDKNKMKPLVLPVQLEFESKNAGVIDAISRVFQAMWGIVKPIIDKIKEDITWLWNKLFGETNAESWINKLAGWLEDIGKFIDEHPMIKDFLASLAEGFILAAGAMIIFTAAATLLSSVNWIFIAIAAAIGLIIFAIKHWGEISEWFSEVWESFTAEIYNNWNNFKNGFSSIFSGFWSYLKESFIKNLEALSQPIRSILNMISGVFETFAGLVTGNWSRFWGGLATIVNGFIGLLKSPLNFIINLVEKFINGIITGINMFSGLLSGVFGLIGMNPIKQFSRVNFPRLESGAVLKGGNPFLAWVNDQPSGQTNVETPLSTMVQAFRVAMQDFQGQSQSVVIEPTGSLSELVRLLNLEIKKEQQFQGGSFIMSGV